MDSPPPTYGFLQRPSHMPRGSLASHVADQLRNAIITLHLRPGTMLDKAEICARLGVSRSPVSDAFARLQSEGLIEILPQRGSVVSLVSVGAVEEYIFVRKALESETCRVLANRRPDRLIAALRENLEAQDSAARSDDKLAFHGLDLEFHEILLSAIGYKRMKAMVDTARNNLDRARQLTNSVRRITVGIAEHIEIVDAIEAGQGDRAASLMRNHLDGVVTEVYGLARTAPHLFAEGKWLRKDGAALTDNP